MHELMHATRLVDSVVTRAEKQVIGIHQCRLRTSSRQLLRRQCLQRRLRTHRYKCRGFDSTMRRGDRPRAR